VIVADVNLVAYLLLGGSESAVAQQVFQRDPAWAAPLLWRSEFRSVLAAHIRQRDLDVRDAWHAHRLAEALFSDQEYPVLGERVLTLVSNSNASAYDCEYVALAEQLDVTLVTADRKLLRAFPDRTVSPRDFVGGRV